MLAFALVNNLKSTKHVQTLEEMFVIFFFARADVFVSSIKWQRFEIFAEQFLNGIKSKVDALEKFINLLTVRKNTISNSKIIRLGGPANPDFVVLELNKYLQQALRPDKAGEVKHYIENKLTVKKYSTSLFHAGASDTLCIVASNNIDPEIWKRVIETEKEQGYFKHTILERDTIVLLIGVLGLKELLSA